MRTSTRWTVAVLAVVTALAIALAAQLRHDSSPQDDAPASQAARTHRDADTAEALAGPRRRAALPPCPAALSKPSAYPAAIVAMREGRAAIHVAP